MLRPLLAGAALIVAGSAASAATPVLSPMNAQPQIVLVAGGCGLAFHRNPFGACVPNRRVFYGPGQVVAPVRLPPPCPRGYHRDPDPARPICYPNY